MIRKWLHRIREEASYGVFRLGIFDYADLVRYGVVFRMSRGYINVELYWNYRIWDLPPGLFGMPELPFVIPDIFAHRPSQKESILELLQRFDQQIQLEMGIPRAIFEVHYNVKPIPLHKP